jgi:hypothetical protein
VEERRESEKIKPWNRFLLVFQRMETAPMAVFHNISCPETTIYLDQTPQQAGAYNMSIQTIRI